MLFDHTPINVTFELFKMDVDDSNKCDSNTSSDQILSRLETEDECIYILTCREGAELKLTVYARNKTWFVTLAAAKLRSMASKVGIEGNEFTEETHRAITGKPKCNENFVYNVSNENGGLLFVWKRHLIKDNIKFQIGSVILREDEASNVSVKSLLNHAVLSNQQLQNRITQLEEENLRLVQERMLVLKRLEECVNIKEQVESELYSKFKLVLNMKKSKIRGLMEAHQSLPCHDDNGVREKEEDTTTVTNDKESIPSHNSPPQSSFGLLGEPVEIVSPPVKKRKRETRQRGSKEPDIPRPPSLSRPQTRVKSRTSRSSSSTEGDDLLQLL